MHLTELQKPDAGSRGKVVHRLDPLVTNAGRELQKPDATVTNAGRLRDIFRTQEQQFPDAGACKPLMSKEKRPPKDLKAFENLKGLVTGLRCARVREKSLSVRAGPTEVCRYAPPSAAGGVFQFGP